VAEGGAFWVGGAWDKSISWVRSVISIAVVVEVSFAFVAAAEVEVERLIAQIGSLEEEHLGALGGLARLDLLGEHGGGPIVIES